MRGVLAFISCWLLFMIKSSTKAVPGNNILFNYSFLLLKFTISCNKIISKYRW